MSSTAEAILCLSICAVPIIALLICLFWNWKAGTFDYQVRERKALEGFQDTISRLVDETTSAGTSELFEEV